MSLADKTDKELKALIDEAYERGRRAGQADAWAAMQEGAQAQRRGSLATSGSGSGGRHRKGKDVPRPQTRPA